MLRKSKNSAKKGQSLLEYAVLFAAIIAVIILMGRYMRNSLSGKFRETADSIGQGEVYKPFGGTNITGSVENIGE